MATSPLLSLVVLAYNQEQYICSALKSAFSQTYSPLEIILSDDFSSDDTFNLMRRMHDEYTGKHRLVLKRNSNNIGLGAHINRVVELAKGKLLLLAAGDDVSLPERAALTAEAWEKSGRRALSLLGDVVQFDDAGREATVTSRRIEREDRFSAALENFNGLFGCTQAFSPELFRIFGPLSESLMVEDKPILFRAFLAGEVVFVPQILVRYRVHAKGLSRSPQLKNLEQAFRAKRRHWSIHLEKLKQFRSDALCWNRTLRNDRVPDSFLKGLDDRIRIAEARIRMCSSNSRERWQSFLKSYRVPLTIKERCRWLIWLLGIPYFRNQPEF